MAQKRQRTIESAFGVEDPSNKRQKVEEVWPKWVKDAAIGEKPWIKKFPPFKAIPMPEVPAEKPGGIRVLKIYTQHARVPDESFRTDPVVPGYTCYRVCKNLSTYHELSPMLLGPVHDENGERYALNIEDGWQCSKVWPFHRNRGGDWLRMWNKWSENGRFSGLALRHRGRGPPLFSLYMGDEMDYVTARKRMYCEWMRQLAVEKEHFKDLRARYLRGENLILLDYDGLRREDPNENVDLTRERLKELVNDSSRPFGHGLVLAALIMDCHVWLDKD